MSDQNDDQIKEEIETVLESNEEETEFALIFRRPSKSISTSELILEIEMYLNDLTKAETTLKSGVMLH